MALAEADRSSGDSDALVWLAVRRELRLKAGMGEALASRDMFAAGMMALAAGFGVECLTNLRQP
jgi:hypothetical protein